MNTYMDDWVRPTEAEIDAALKAALVAALESIGDLPEDEESGRDFMVIALRAFAAVVKSLRDEHKSRAAGREHVFPVHGDERHIVATAIWIRSRDMDIDDDVHPYAKGANPWVGLVQACIAMDAASTLAVQVDAEGQCGVHDTDTILEMIEASDES